MLYTLFYSLYSRLGRNVSLETPCAVTYRYSQKVESLECSTIPFISHMYLEPCRSGGSRNCGVEYGREKGGSKVPWTVNCNNPDG